MFESENSGGERICISQICLGWEHNLDVSFRLYKQVVFCSLIHLFKGKMTQQGVGCWQEIPWCSWYTGSLGAAARTPGAPGTVENLHGKYFWRKGASAKEIFPQTLPGTPTALLFWSLMPVCIFSLNPPQGNLGSHKKVYRVKRLRNERLCSFFKIDLFYLFVYFYYYFFFGCVGPSFLCAGFL